jgi:hypothetical protein
MITNVSRLGRSIVWLIAEMIVDGMFVSTLIPVSSQISLRLQSEMLQSNLFLRREDMYKFMDFPWVWSLSMFVFI